MKKAADEGASAMAIVVGAAGGGQGAPGCPGGPGGRGDPVDPGDRGDAGGTGDPRGPGVTGEAGATAGGVPQIEQAPYAPGPGRNAAPAAGGPGNQLRQFILTVPFPSPMEAEIAHRFLTRNAELRGPVQKELSVNGSILTVRLTAEDPGQLRISVTTCLDQLFLVMRTMQRFGPPVSR